MREAVAAALAQYPSDAAAVTEGRNDADASVWGIEVLPARAGAAAAYITFAGGDEVVVGFGKTHAYLWDDDPSRLADEVRLLLTAVFRGDFEEVGDGDGFARVYLPNGEVMRLGAMHLPLPWRIRRRRQYQPLSSA